MGNIRNSLISFQSWVKKLNTLKKSLLISRINSLRGDFLINSHQISELQADLNRLVDIEISEKIKNMKLFEGLNSEKPSPLFMALARNKGKGSLSQLKDDGGANFNSEEELGEYIADFYETLYRAPPNEDVENNRIVEDFLGEDICNSDMVRNSKLTGPETELQYEICTRNRWL